MRTSPNQVLSPRWQAAQLAKLSRGEQSASCTLCLPSGRGPESRLTSNTQDPRLHSRLARVAPGWATPGCGEVGFHACLTGLLLFQMSVLAGTLTGPTSEDTVLERRHIPKSHSQLYLPVPRCSSTQGRWRGLPGLRGQGSRQAWTSRGSSGGWQLPIERAHRSQSPGAPSPVPRSSAGPRAA